MSTPTTRLVSPSDIATLAGRTRAAVSNWRKNDNLQFPRPVGGTPARPLFDLAEITAWLAERGIVVETQSPSALVWTALNRFRGAVPVENYAALALPVLCAAKVTRGQGHHDDLWRGVRDAAPGDTANTMRRISDQFPKYQPLLELPRLETDRPTGEFLKTLIEAATAVDPAGEALARMGDEILQRASAVLGRGGTDSGSPKSRTAELLATAGIRHRNAQRLYDPALGVGEALINSATQRAPGQRNKLQLLASEINAATIVVAQQRALLHGVEITCTLGDALDVDLAPLDADVVVAEPPLGMRWFHEPALADPRWAYGLPSGKRTELLWLQHVVYHLSEQGTGYILTAMGPLFTGGRDAQVRANLVHSGWVDTIVALPPKMLPNTAIPLALWVLRRDPARESIRFIDASESESPETDIGTWLDCPVESDVVLEASVSIDQILEADADLTPGRWIVRDVIDPEATAAKFTGALSIIEAELPATHIALPRTLQFSGVRTITVGELIQERRARIIPGQKLDDPEAVGAWKPIDVRTAFDSSPRYQSISGGATDPEARSAQPGDIVLTATHTITAIVASEADRPVHAGVAILRLLSDDFDPRYVAACLAASWNSGHTRGSVIPRVDVRTLEIPLLPRSEQDRLITALDRAHRLELAARRLTDAGATLANSLLEAAYSGTTLTRDDD